MSIALLHQVYDETRRLAVAGSATAPGDFRLKKLIDPLKQAGTKAPVFAKLADSANALITSNEQTASDALLELLGLATAIRYTQGETGLAGKIEPLGAKIPLARPTEIPARTLQPLMQALTRTGGGRYEVIADAASKDVFKDVRLVRLAVAGLDDSFSEIAELFAKKIIPESYGAGIAQLIREGYDPKGKGGAARRLQLLHKFDPTGTRELVMQALETGSKEVRVAALSCLGLHSDDVHILIEQTSAKAQDVRIAAYFALAQIDGEEAVNALRKAMAGKELAFAWKALAASKGPRLLKATLVGCRKELGELFALKDKKEISAKIERLGYFLHTLHERTDKDSEAMVLELFALRDKLAKVKGDTLSGKDTNLDVVRAMAGGTKGLAEKLIETHAKLDGEPLALAFDAAATNLPAERVYEIFSHYFSAKGKVVAERVMIQQQRTNRGSPKSRPVDPRWLDLALAARDDELIQVLARPGHKALNDYLAQAFAEYSRAGKKPESVRFAVETMAAVGHPEFERSFFAALDAMKGKFHYHTTYFYGTLTRHLPKSAIPALEAVIPKLGDTYSKYWVNCIEELRAKPDAA